MFGCPLSMFGNPLHVWMSPSMFGHPHLFADEPNIFGCTHCMFGCPHMSGCSRLYVWIPPYVWMSPAMFVDPICMDAPICLDNPLYSLDAPNTFGHCHMFGCPHPNTWGSQTCGGQIQTSQGVSKHVGMSNHTEGCPKIGGTQTYRGIQCIWGVQRLNMGYVKTYRLGIQNI